MKIAHNPQTGEYFGLQNGQWLPVRIAQNDAGDRWYLGENGWEPLNTGGAMTPGESEPIDDRTGAGWKERFAIGSAADNKGKLERARAFYGDSVRMEPDERISFVNPETGRRTYVNPSGLDWGDIAGGGRELLSMLASVPAALAGTVGGGGVNLVTGALAGSAGGAAAGQAVDAFAAGMARDAARERGNAIPEAQTLGAAAAEFGTETALGTVGGTVLGGVGRAASAALNPMKQSVVQAFRNLDFPIPSVGSATGGKGGAIYENALGSMLGGTQNMERAAARAAGGLQDVLDRESARMAGGAAAASPYELGQAAKDAAAASLKDFRQQNTRFYDDFTNQWGSAPASLTNVKAAIDDMTAGLSPESSARLKSQLAALLQHELADDAAGGLNVATVKAARTRIGDALNAPSVVDTSSVGQGQLRRLYGALADDYRAGITDPDALRALSDHNTWEAAQHNARELLDRRLFGNRDAQQVGGALLRSDLAPETVEALRKTLAPADFDAMRGGILRNVGRPLASEGLADGTASAAQTSKMLGRGRGAFARETQDALWGKDVDDIRTVADALAVSARNANTSKTAQTSQAMAMIRGPLKLVQAGATLNPTTATLGAASIASPWALSRLTTSQPVINWLARTQSPLSRGVFNYGFPITGIQMGANVPLTDNTTYGGLLGEFARSDRERR